MSWHCLSSLRSCSKSLGFWHIIIADWQFSPSDVFCMPFRFTRIYLVLFHLSPSLPSISLSHSLSPPLSVPPSLPPSLCPPPSFSLSLSVFLFYCLSVCLSLCLSVTIHLSIPIDAFLSICSSCQCMRFTQQYSPVCRLGLWFPYVACRLRRQTAVWL